ncbi:MAG: hypothetical protein M3478_11580, partial [Planctomycetota bacterium]|nr:hypothetical protein [Planctomycetota bacterium]
PHSTVGDALSAAARERRGTPAEWEATRTCGAAAPYYNGGVVLWRTSDASHRFFDAWHAEWRRFRGIDQFALVRALMRSGRRVATLPPRFNTLSIELPNAAAAARAGVCVLHFCPHTQQSRMAEFVRELRYDVHLMTIKGGGGDGVV